MFHALDARYGTPIWRYDISQDGMQKSFHGNMLIEDSLVFVGTDIPSGHVYAFGIRDGAVRWKRFTGLGVHGDIVGSDSVLYALTKEDTLLCLVRRTGDLLWSFHPGDTVSRWNDSSPSPVDGRVFFRDSGNHVYAMDASNGACIWKRALPDNPLTSISLAHGGLYVGARDRNLYRLAMETGEVEKTLSIGDEPYGTITCTDHGMILFTGRRGRGDALLSVEPDLSAVRWRRPAPPGTTWTTYRPMFWNGTVLVGDGSGIVSAFRLADGRGEWSLDVGGTVKTVSHVGDTLLVGTFEGLLHAFDITTLRTGILSE